VPGSTAAVSSDGEAARVIVHHRNVVQAATQCRIGHVVLLSGLDTDLQSPFCWAYTNGDTERLLRASGRPYSIVRAGLFTQGRRYMPRSVPSSVMVAEIAVRGAA
jgi:NAD(P)H dehydrogenase (quinone)